MKINLKGTLNKSCNAISMVATRNFLFNSLFVEVEVEVLELNFNIIIFNNQ